MTDGSTSAEIISEAVIDDAVAAFQSPENSDLTEEHERGARRSSVLKATEPSSVGMVLLLGVVLVSLVAVVAAWRRYRS